MVAAAAEGLDLVVAGDDGERRGEAAMGERDAGDRGHRDGARDARHDLDVDAGVAAERDLLAAAPEDERVAALEPHDLLAVAGEGDEQLVDGVLRHRVVAGELADVDDLGAERDALGGEPVEHPAGAEPVGDDHVGRLERAESAEREQAGVAGAGAHERDGPPCAREVSSASPAASLLDPRGFEAGRVAVIGCLPGAGRGGGASVARAGRRTRAR